MAETQTSGTTSGTTEVHYRSHEQWKQNIREEAMRLYAERWVFDEYDEISDRYDFYFYDLDGEYGCYSLSSKEINRMVLFMKHTEAERKYNKHKRDML